MKPRSVPTRNRRSVRLALLEPLEDRRLLATLTVNTASDTVGPTDPTLSLREAIEVSDGTLAISALSTQRRPRSAGLWAVRTPSTSISPARASRPSPSHPIFRRSPRR